MEVASTGVMIMSGTLALAAAILISTYVLVSQDTVPETSQIDVIPDATQAEAASATPQSEQSSRDLSLVEIFEMTESGVVRLMVIKGNDTEDGSTGVGSGIVFNKMGHIVTNAHVVDDANRTEVTFLDGRSYRAEIVGVDVHTDLAVVRVDADPNLLTPLLIGDSGNLKVGERIAAIGNPFGLSGSMTAGIVSQLNRLLPVEETGFSIPDIIQTDAAINPGNSGGPLLNSRGEVIGVNTAIQSATGEFSGVGFAVPSQTVAKIIPTLISQGKYDHPWIGVSGTDISPLLAEALNRTDTRGFLIIGVVEDSPAGRAGLQGSNDTIEYEGAEFAIGGDIVMMVDDVEVRKISDILIHLQRAKSVGDEMQLQVLRDGEFMEITLVLDKRPESPR